MFLQKLKSETAKSHFALEQNPYSINLMSPKVSLEDYSTYLQKLYGFIFGFERTVFPKLQKIDPDINLRRKSELMQHDLWNLKCDFTKLPTLSDEAFNQHYTDELTALGGLYVLEGSMLGGVMIKKHLIEKLGNEVFDNTKYFTGYGSETGKVWKNFLNILSFHAADAEKEQIIIKSANNTFDLLNQWMTKSSLNRLDKNEHQKSC